MPGLVPPAGPKPLRRGEGPGIHVLTASQQEDVDGRDKPGHDKKGRKNLRIAFPVAEKSAYFMRALPINSA
jgi:hypothetical protein